MIEGISVMMILSTLCSLFHRKPSPLLVALIGGAALGIALFSYVYRPWADEDDYETLTEAQQAKVDKMNVKSPISVESADTIVKKWQVCSSVQAFHI